MENENYPETDLDPQDWSSFRMLAHRMVDDALAHLEHIREKRVWQPPQEATRSALSIPVPHEPAGEEAAYEAFKEHVLNQSLGNTHPRFWGWVMGNGVPYAVLADMLAATVNPNMGGGDHIPNYVERQVVDWCKEMFGFPAGSSGILTSGGSMANFIGLAVARNARAGYDVRAEGVRASPRPMTVYASAETHSSNYKAVEQLGIGKDWMRFIPVNDHYEMDITLLERAIRKDKAAGCHPICIIGNAATTNTGAFDDLQAIADICERENIWFHVDGAFGSLVALSDRFKHLVDGMDRADSLAFDLHKWMYMPFEVGGILIRSFDAHLDTFAVTPDYLTHMPRGPAGGEHAWFGDMGLQLTRSFRALKVWMSITAYGLDHFRRQIDQDILHAGYLAGKISAHDCMELLDHVPLNIVCFRYTPPGLDGDSLDALNLEILMRLQERGLAVPSYTRLKGCFSLRVSITNHRSRRSDFDFLLDQIADIAKEVLEEEY